MNLGVVNTVIFILMEYSNGSLATLAENLGKIHKMADEMKIEKFRERSCVTFIWQFMFFWKKHYTDPRKYEIKK